MEKKFYKGIDVTYLDEEDYSYLYELSDREVEADKEFLEIKNKAKSLTKEVQYINCFMEGYFAARDKSDLKEGVRIWQSIFKHEKQKFDYDGSLKCAEKGWKYYFETNGISLPSSSK